MKRQLLAALAFCAGFAAASGSADAALITTQMELSDTVQASQLLFDPQLGTLLDAQINMQINGTWVIENGGGSYASLPGVSCSGSFISSLFSPSLGDFLPLNFYFDTPVSVRPYESLRVPVTISDTALLDVEKFTLSASGPGSITWVDYNDLTQFTDYLLSVDEFNVIPTHFEYDGLLTISYTYNPAPPATPVPEPTSALLLAAGAVSALFSATRGSNRRC